MKVVLNSLGRKLVHYLIESVGPVSANLLAEKIGCTPRMVRYQMKDVEAWLTENNVLLRRAPRRGFWVNIDEGTRKKLEACLRFADPYARKLSPGERHDLLLALLLGKHDWYSMSALVKEFCVSRATLIKDIEEVRRKLEPYGLSLKASKKQGYKVIGPERSIRQALADIVLRSRSEADLLAKLRGEGRITSGNGSISSGFSPGMQGGPHCQDTIFEILR